ncbi:MAG: adenylate/guanylate cyclase domain-containing protein [Acidimicrobiia bacterium]|nr:adenylate/guanylate cyclase domain-containing protein [Acidimicrobiia bacterium]
MRTFLFTDIESSTRLWEEHPKEMAVALARHDEILASAIDSAGGTLLKTTGDGAIAVFGSADDAVRACIDSQLALRAEQWDTAEVRVRMGVHAGDTQTRDDDHFGPVMNRTARIMASGHGGQVVVSALTVELAIPGLSPGTTFRDLGSHRLKDLTEPEHLYQLMHEGLPVEFPTLRTLDSRPNNLPLQSTDLVGRSQELAAIHLMLENPSTRLLTIAGPGGAGKTRLGLQVAADLMDSFRDGVWFVDLAADTTPAEAFETVVRVLSLPVSRTGAPLDVLKNRLRDRQMLLVLDNLEQVIDAGAGIGELLRSAPELRVVVTSRETLRIRGEQVYPVPPLSLPHPGGDAESVAASEAVQLFIDRATAARPDFSLTDDNAGHVAAICLRLDGLPLAIELAAARLTVFSPSDLLARLKDRLDVLASGGRDLPDRQRTLWGAIGWSYELLDGEERALFELFAVFAGTEVVALEEVAGEVLGVGSIVDTLASLVDKNLVRRVDTGGTLRFVMLQMIKEYAADQLAQDAGRQHDSTAAHADYYASFADQQAQLDGPDREVALDRLEVDLDNLRSSWEFWNAAADETRLARMFGALWDLHVARGWYHGAIELAEDRLAVLDQTEPTAERDAAELTLRVRQARALMAVHGYNLEVERAFSRALELTEAVGTAEDRVPVLRALASYYLQMGDPPRSMAIGQELLEMGTTIGDEAVEIEAHSVLGNTLLYFDAAACLDHLGIVIERYDPSAHGRTRFRLGPDTGVVARIGSAMMLWETGRLDSAVAMADDALEFAASIDHPYSLAWVLYHRGFLGVARGRFEEVLATSRQLAEVSDEHDFALWRTLATVLEGVALTATGDGERGVALTEQGVELYQGLAPPPIFWPLVLGLRADVHAMAGNLPASLELVDEGIGIWEEFGLLPPDFAIRRSDLLLAMDGSIVEAERFLEDGIAAASGLGMRLPELRARTKLVRLRRARGAEDDGASELASLLGSFTEGGDEADVIAAKDVLRA